ncbi:ImmA/IrrE family metallo-endopeptidase [Clostridium botulinum]|nr:ImmA/IrrE family metallo-endopeptidase [Clostridium botulinum]MBZ1334406.1 ImmA/IrrE family metallo-endopeptidase [Clostridium botulinum]MBZ1337897.1 ImmA/IrrE family metallo-endopeptidase [Clostridium botulinum]MBZ1340429.1 ImmA/IrrE family metallo-endopeptidase [Clostridium botulinum]MBZ1344862.1 ImmA/IrrE family metallo-endopeptidase [Clostridium botulinum]
MIIKFEKAGVEVIEDNLGTTKPCGKCIDNLIIINNKINTCEKRCILAEELGHFFTSFGDITNQSKINNKKQEVVARRWGYNKLIPISALKKAYRKGYKTKYEIAEYLQVTENFLSEAMEYYKCKNAISI